MAYIDNEEKERTLFCGSLHPKVTEEILYELFLQAGPLEKVKLVKNKNFAFITFRHSISVPYSIQLMNGIRLYQKPLLLQTRTGTSNVLSQSSMPNTNLLTPPATPTLPHFSNGSVLLQAPSTTTPVPKSASHDAINTPYHRSLSQPNFTLNRNPCSEPRRNEPVLASSTFGKTKLMPNTQNHRTFMPYSRTSTPDPRFDRNNRFQSFTRPFLVPSPIHLNTNMMNMMSSLSWQGTQLASQRRF